MSRNLVICCDGTGDEFGDLNSNVVKLYSTLVIDASQIGYYRPGVGTMGAPTAHTWLERQWTRVKGLAFGAGFRANVGDAYRYLMNAYRTGDRVFIFGFSRGAYTARALVGLIYLFGLMEPGNEAQIPYMLRLFTRRRRDEDYWELAHQFKWSFSRECPVHFVGVWDTVSSIGWITRELSLPYTAHNPGIKIGRQAVSIDERRCYFRANLWLPPAGGGEVAAAGSTAASDIKQAWFAGVHSDVGGSYPEKESGLSKNALEWMLVEAADGGLKVDPARVEIVLARRPRPNPWMPAYVPPDPQAQMHESLTGLWWLLEFFPHRYYDYAAQRRRWRIPLGARRVIPEDSLIHESVLLRMNNGIGYSPKLPQRYTVEPTRNCAAPSKLAAAHEA